MSKFRKKKKYKKVIVNWIDSSGMAGWTHSVEGDFRPHNCVTSGYLLKNEKDFIVVTSTIADESEDQEQYLHLVCIPKCSIKRIKK